MNITCDRCMEELSVPGGLLFGPPEGSNDLCEKLHLCVPCYHIVRDVVLGVVIVSE